MMVKLPTIEEEAPQIRGYRPQNHRRWGKNLTPAEREQARRPPRTLEEMEVLVQRTLALMVKHGTEPDDVMVVQLLREQYDLPAAMPCTICNGVHGYFEPHPQR